MKPKRPKKAIQRQSTANPPTPTGKFSPTPKRVPAELLPRAFDPIKLNNYLMQSSLSPSDKALMRYYDNVHAQAEDEAEFAERSTLAEIKLDRLESEAKQGHIYALRELAYLAHECTRRLNQWAEHYPEFVRHVAARFPSWPILKTLSSARDNDKEFLRKIHLDLAKVMVTDGSKATADSAPAKKWAVRLLCDLQGFRVLYGAKSLYKGTWWNLWPMTGTSPEALAIYRKHPDLREAVVQLPDLDPVTVGKWWANAQELLSFLTNGKQWEGVGLERYVNSKRVQGKKVHEKELKGIDSLKRSEVEKAVRQAFFNLVPDYLGSFL